MKIKNIKIKKHFKKAATLAEVMIVLGIISTVMVTSITVMSTSMLRIRINDIEDSANTLMIKGLEIAKSPASVSTDNDLLDQAFDTPTYFSLETDNSIKQVVTSSAGAINSCTDASVYNATDLLPTSSSSTPDICVQIEIIPRLGPQNKRIFETISRTVYNVPGEDPRVNSIRGYRYAEF